MLTIEQTRLISTDLCQSEPTACVSMIACGHNSIPGTVAFCVQLLAFTTAYTSKPLRNAFSLHEQSINTHTGCICCCHPYLLYIVEEESYHPHPPFCEVSYTLLDVRFHFYFNVITHSDCSQISFVDSSALHSRRLLPGCVYPWQPFKPL